MSYYRVKTKYLVYHKCCFDVLGVNCQKGRKFSEGGVYKAFIVRKDTQLTSAGHRLIFLIVSFNAFECSRIVSVTPCT